MSNDDKYIIRPEGGFGSEEPNGGNGEGGEEPSLEQYVFANSVVQTALIHLLVDKGLITLEELTTQIEKVRKEM